MTLLLLAVGTIAFSGVPGLFIPPRSNIGQVVSIVLTVIGSLTGVVIALRVLLPGQATQSAGPWPVFGEGFSLFLDPLAAVFLVSIFLIPALGALYGWGYWKQSHHPENGRKLRFFYGWVTAGMALVVLSRGIWLFLIAWEIMAISAFLLINTEDEKQETREAGWVYFVAAHLSTLILFGLFSWIIHLTGIPALLPFKPGALSGQVSSLLFLLALAGFGLKAGLFPFHVWLPAAHANAPSHVSALLSGVLLKVGVYGFARVCWLLPEPLSWWGSLVLMMGIVSSVVGVVFAIGQHDLKRLLAYHSVENIGIIFMGLGLGLLGRSWGHPELVLLGMAGALLHVWNHGLFKALLFLSAGSVIHSIPTRQMDEMGGIAGKMPRTAMAFLVGAAAICGLPPLNGFISELFIFMGSFKLFLLHGMEKDPSYLLAAPALALTGGLALSCFTKAYGAVFLGQPRTTLAASAKENGRAILFPMMVLGVVCFGIGLFPALVAPFMESAAGCWGSLPSEASLSLSGIVPLWIFPLLGFSLLGIVFLGVGWLDRGKASSRKGGIGTWDCGYLQPRASMQYTSSSYAQMLVHFFRWILIPRKTFLPLKGLFPTPGVFHTHVPETLLDRLILPLVWAVQWLLAWVRWIQLGYLQLYVFYIVLTLVFLILLN